MKRLLLFSLAIGITIGAVAQNKFAVRNNKTLSKKEAVKIAEQEVPFLPTLKPHGAHTKALNGIIVGTSANVFGYLTAVQNWVDYNAATNTVMFTHRAGGAWGGSSGDIRCKYSTDWFASAIDSVVFPTNGTQLHRYPSGVIYNPTGNTVATNAFAAVVGPVTGGSGWTDNFFHTQRLDKTLLTNFYNPIVAPETALERTNLSGGNGNLYVMSQDDDGTNYLPYVKIRKGIFNTTTNAFDWSLTPTQISRLWGKRIFANGASDANYAWNHAWANDGLNGYAFCTGIDSLNKFYQGTQLPLIWRTTDGGVTYQAIAPYSCFDKLTNLTDSIWPTIASLTGGGALEFRPFFNAGSSVDDNTLPGVVDANGDLHMAAIIEGYYSSHIDSLDYSFSNQPTFLFDVIYDWSANTWDVRFIDVINSANVLDDNGAAVVSSSGNMGWEHWINVSRSDDGNVIFFTWTDTDPSYGTDNIVPDIKGRAWRITDNMATASKNFTDPNGGLYYYVNTADVVKKEGSIYSVALTYIDVAGDGGNNGDGPQIIYFANDVNFDESEFTILVPASNIDTLNTCLTGIPSTRINTMSVSQNYPNPVNGTTSIKVTLAETSNVAVEITNMLGQSVSKVDKGRLAAGSHGINLNVANLNSGIYFYTVTAGTQKITKKMIVE